MDAKARAESLSCWQGPVTAEPLGGGMTNANFLVRDGGQRFVVRIGADIPQHQVMRFNERAAALAAHAAGLSPRLVHHEPGALVVDFVEGRTLTPEMLREEGMLARIAALIRDCHAKMPQHLRGPLLMFWPFHVLRDYAATLREGASRWTSELPRLMEIGTRLERLVSPVEIAFCHNDLLAANLIDDGTRLWLIDWDYAGFNSPLFDLANLASNNGLDAAQESELLRLYFEREAEAELMASYRAMRAASLLREAMWGMVSELHSTLDVDYVAYAREHLARFQAELGQLDLR
jgi:thiamine kinase-like enzyme